MNTKKIAGRPCVYEINIDRVNEMLQSGMTIKSIANELGMPVLTLTRRIKSSGLKIVRGVK